MSVVSSEISRQNPNPLLAEGLPMFSNIAAEHALPAVERRLAEYQALLDELAEADLHTASPLDWIQREVLIDDQLAQTWSSIGHLHAVQNTPAWRAAYSACLQKITAFYTARGQNLDLFKLWQAAADAEDFSGRSAAFQRMVQNELDDFRLSGIDLPKSQRTRFAEISLELSSLSNQFGNRVLDATEAYAEIFDHAETLAGLPESALDILYGNARAANVNGLRADLSYPCFHAINTYADDRDLRQRFYQAHATRASELGPNAQQFDNGPLIQKMLKLRHEQAELLGYANAAEVKLVKRMAEHANVVVEFLSDLAARAKPLAQTQLAELNEYARNRAGPETLEAWDIAYWSEKMREHTIGLSQDKLKDYFELENTLSALFDLSSKLFGLRFEHDKSVPTWHNDVRFYRIHGQDSKSEAAGMYIDLYSRSRKQGGAWMDICRQRLALNGQARAPVAYLTCNFAATGDGKPSLLRHDDVVTLFHEFGHCLHHLLSKVDWPPVAGISGVEWDAVELPSQLFEGWVWEPEFLQSFARHHATGEPIPHEWIAAMNDDRQFLGAMALTRQIEFALTDLTLHQSANVDPIETMQTVHEQVAITPMPEFNRYLMSFSHLFDGGYAAGYYSYLWAERLARDAFEVFQQEGLWDAEAGRQLREEILSVGGSRPMQHSWQAFRGREARLEPLLTAYGIGV